MKDAAATTELTLLAPMSGWCAALDEAPDEVFATRMLGDGVLIDPTEGQLVAPCDGEVLAVPASRHAVTMRAESGAELLLHIGIDTVNLGGAGFTAHVAAGEQVRAGAPLITFDLDAVALRARSLVSPVLLAGSVRHAIMWRHDAGPVRAGEPLMRVRRSGADDVATTTAAASTPTAVTSISREVRVLLPHGIHARPAALLARRARDFVADMHVQKGERTANLRSAMALMGLGVRGGDVIVLEALGRDAALALAAIEAALQQGAESEAPPSASVSASVSASAVITAPPIATAQDGKLPGVVASRGFAVGVATRLARLRLVVREEGSGIEFERSELQRARATARARLERISGTSPGPQREIIAAHLEFLDDPVLLDAAHACIAQGRSAGFAWRAALGDAAAVLEGVSDARIAGRADDLRDLESQVLLALEGEAHPPAIALPDHAIVLAEELLPSQVVALDTGRLAGIATEGGGPTSHVAILASAMNVPMLVGLGAALREIGDGAVVILDAEQGELHAAPKAHAIALAERAVARRREHAAAEQAAAHEPCATIDGERIEVFANVGSPADAGLAVRYGAEGCGLLRTEFLFLDRRLPPEEREQADAYQRIMDVFAGRPVVIRTLDAGGDKPIAYLPMPQEANPALGLRGIRSSLREPGLLRAQLRAILAVRPRANCRVLLPMINDAAEVRAVRAVVDEVAAETGVSARIAVGAMIETPAAALTAERIAREVDFVSIGTNDLMQYTLAMDRTHPALAPRTDALHPAVLRMIGAAVEGARGQGRPVAVCGAAASDLLAVPILIGLGVRELSVVPASVPRVKALVRRWTLQACRELASDALGQGSAEDVRSLATRHGGKPS